MALTNLGELKAAVADWINREDLTSVIPDFIKIGESRINSDYRSRVASNEFETTLEVAPSFQQNPVNLTGTTLFFGEVTTVVVDGEVIPYVSWEVYTKQKKESEYKNGCWTFQGDAIFYSKFVEENETPPVSGNNVELKIYGYNDSLLDFNNDADDTPFFLAHPNIYLYAALVEASVYLRDMEGVQIYQARYDELLDKVYKDHKRSKVSGGMAVSSVGGDYNFDRSY